ncbi:hypothetical protein NB693_22945 [Pantoea ananatis]|uniref:hypothetical protein n=1 Tax=Pantoea ananas TaxID=553 RepID=UPI002220C210|nr:hypothetical protein [Pantoea ananatis]
MLAEDQAMVRGALGALLGWIRGRQRGRPPGARCSPSSASSPTAQRLRTQSIRDPLTGLYNRRYLEESLGGHRLPLRRRGVHGDPAGCTAASAAAATPAPQV